MTKLRDELQKTELRVLVHETLIAIQGDGLPMVASPPVETDDDALHGLSRELQARGYGVQK